MSYTDYIPRHRGKDVPVVVHVIPQSKGGGAEKIVQKLTHHLSSCEMFSSYCVYFSSGISVGQREIYFGIRPRSIGVIPRLRSTIKSIKRSHPKQPIILHSHLTWGLYYTAIASAGLGVKLCYTEHSSYNKRRRLAFLRGIDRAIYGRYDRIVCISNGVQEKLLDWLGQKFSARTQVIYNGVEISNVSSPKDRRRKPVYLYVGSLKKMKGVDILMPVMAHLKEEWHHLDVVGDGPMREKLEAEAIAWGIATKVKFHGWKNNVAKFYPDSDFVIMPSHWEGFGLVAVEAMSHGTPIVASDVAGLREVFPPSLRHKLLVSNFRSCQAWVSSLSALANEPERYREISNACLQYSRNFGLNGMIEAHKELYVELCSLKN